MKKLNKKGFTLIELLAIIVILAIIMVITIPTVLNSLQNARKNSLETAVATIEKYMQDTLDACEINDNDLASCDPDVYKAITGVELGGALTNKSNVIDAGSIIEKAGYKTSDVYKIKFNYTSTGNKVTIVGATSTENGKFKKATFGNTDDITVPENDN